MTDDTVFYTPPMAKAILEWSFKVSEKNANKGSAYLSNICLWLFFSVLLLMLIAYQKNAIYNLPRYKNSGYAGTDC